MFACAIVCASVHMGLFECVQAVSPLPWRQVCESVQNVILSLQAIMQQTKPDTHMEPHTIKLNKNTAGLFKPQTIGFVAG